MINFKKLGERQSSRDTLSESGAFRIISECEMAPAVELTENVRRPECPRCHQEVTASARVCKHCNLYLVVSDRTWKNALPTVASELKKS